MPTYTALDHALEIGRRHHQAGRLAEGERVYREILAQNPNHATALHMLGAIAHQVGKSEAAEELMLRAVVLDPASPQFHFNLGLVQHALGKLDAAAGSYSNAVRLRPTQPDGFLNLGNVLSDQEKLDKAEQAFGRVLQLDPNNAAAYSNLGVIQKKRGKFAESLSYYRKAISLKPASADAYSNMASSLTELRRLDDAIAAANKAIQLEPDCFEAYTNLAMALRERGRLDEAFTAACEALKRRPNLAEAYLTMGNVRADQGRLIESMEFFERATELKPSDARLQSNRLYAMHFHPTYDARRIYDEHRKYNEIFAKPLKRLMHLPPPASEASRKLRIGYVSANLHTHPIGRFILPALQFHDSDQFEILCYSDTRTPDALTSKLAGYSAGWRDVAGWDDERVAQLIHDDRIDILVDLTMHMAYGRPLVFARKPAPVQVTYLAYCSTMGLDAIDYRFTDRYLDPPDSHEQMHYSERSVWLQTYWLYEPGIATPPVSPLPATNSGHITFGCLNNFSKASSDALIAWSRVLQAVPNSRMILHALPGGFRTDIIQLMSKNGVDSSRLTFVGKLPMFDYFAQYGQIDIALDPFPCTGGTTTCDAMWMGVPVVTLAGKTAVGRSGVSLLSNVGLPNWIARSQDEYVALAAQFAGNLPALAELRAGLRDRMLKSPLSDGAQFAKDLDAAYREMWRKYVQDSPVL